MIPTFPSYLLGILAEPRPPCQRGVRCLGYGRGRPGSRRVGGATARPPVRSDPGAGVGGQCPYPFRKVATRDIRDRDQLEDLALAGPQCDPDVLERLRRALVADVLRPLAAHVGERAVDDPDDLCERDVVG